MMGEPRPVTARIELRFLACTVAVETDSLRLAARLESYFAPYLSPGGAPADVELRALAETPVYDAARMRPWRPSPGRRLKERSYDTEDGVRFILKDRTGMLIVLGGAEKRIAGDVEAHANQVINLIGTLFGLSLLDQGYVMVHASAVVGRRDRRALVFLGNSGSGKSSVALRLVERGGFDFLSNDRVLMRAGAVDVDAAGLPKQPRVNPGTLLASKALARLLPRARRRLYSALPPAELWQYEEKTDVDVERDLGARSLLSATLGRIYALQWRADDEGLGERALDPDAAVAALLGTAKDFGPYDLRAPRPAPADAFRRIAGLVPVIAVSGRRDPAVLADAIASITER